MAVTFMKRLLTLIALVPLIAFGQGLVPSGTSLARIGYNGQLIGSVIGATGLTAPCETVMNDATGTAADGSTLCFNQDYRYYIASQIVASNTATICQIDVYIDNTNGFNGNVTCELWTDNGSDSPSEVTGSGQTIAASSITGSATVPTSFSVSASVTSGTKYWIVLRSNQFSSTSVVRWYRFNVPSGLIKYSTAASTWNSDTTTRRSRYKIFTQ